MCLGITDSHKWDRKRQLVIRLVIRLWKRSDFDLSVVLLFILYTG